MPRFVLVHGSGQNASCWDRVRAELTARGHASVAPELPKTAGLRLADFADVIASTFDDPDAVVVAHSLCGIFLPLVAERRPCRALVYLAAVIPQPGASVREQFAAEPAMFEPSWIAAGARWGDPAQREALAREFLFHDGAPEAMAWSLAGLDAIDSRSIVKEPAPYAALPAVRAAAIVAAHDRTLSAAWCAARARRVLGVEPIVIPTGHCPQNVQPAALAELLVAVAAG
ncbi:MAG: alpha/beta hydrolase [Planctomycetes bacterium]|nr:alpha/beta hydrolase [Planctomycetota bacterium]